jgi:hypothetical protein
MSWPDDDQNGKNVQFHNLNEQEVEISVLGCDEASHPRGTGTLSTLLLKLQLT